MTRTPSRTRFFSVRAPITTEGDRAHFQRRLAFTSLVVFALGFGFWLITLVLLVFVGRQHIVHMFMTPTSQVQLATNFAGLAVWFFLRRGTRSTLVLDAVDALSAIGLCAGWCVMIWFDAGGRRAELVALLACSFTLVVRAALIPSTAGRTLGIGALALAPLLPVTYALNARAPDAMAWALGPTIYMAIWIAVALGCTTVISSVIYGLRQEVRRAMQLGQYLLEEKIGEGGMGVVYRASHAMLRRATAIKLLTGNAATAAERFEREVRITARLTHPNTVAVFDYGRTPDGAFYYAMEYIDGVTLEDLVTEHGPQPVRRVAHVVTQICGALEEAHAAGLVHRDIKPANVMLTERGVQLDVVKVLDFGLVKEVAGPTEDLGLSGTNTILGTPHYMAPEAIVDPKGIDGRADIYAVGATAYYLLTGARVFDGANLVEICSQHLHQDPVPPRERRPEIPESLEKVVLACLAKDPDDRPADASTLAEMVGACGLGEWTRAEARAWWAERKGESGPRRKASPSTASALGATIAVALDGRNGPRVTEPPSSTSLS